MRDKRRSSRTPVDIPVAPMPEATLDRLRKQLVATSPHRSPRVGALTRILSLLVMSACGGLSTAGLLTQTNGADGGGALGVAQIGEGGPALGFEDGASTDLALSPPQTVDAAPAPSLADASADLDVDGDGAQILPGRPDGSAADSADLDAETPCGALAQCCSRLIVAPPLAAACYVTAQSDAGARGCGSTLATFQDSGLCP